MNPPHSEDRAHQRTLVVHYAGTWSEAVVIRGLLESAGIASPAPTTTDPFPLRETPRGTHGVEIQVLESQVDDARRVIAEHLTSADEFPPEENEISTEET